MLSIASRTEPFHNKDVDREVADRFERIEIILEQTARIGQENERALSALSTLHEQNQRTLGLFIRTIETYTTAADARMKRMEENLDALIRAITAEHTNGRSQG